MHRPLPIVNTTISNANKDTLLSKKTESCKVNHANKARINACERGAYNMILAAVEDTWVRELRSSDTYYARVPLSDLLKHLAIKSDGLGRPDVITIFAQLLTLSTVDPQVPE